MSTLTYVTGVLNLTLNILCDKTSGDVSEVRESLNVTGSDTLANGILIDQQDEYYADRRTVAAAAEDLDLTSLTDALNRTVSFQKVKGIFIKNLSVSAGEILTVGGDANSLPFLTTATDSIKVGPDGLLLLTAPSVAGITVTGGTGDIIQIDPGAASITYDIVIWGIKT